MCGGDAREVSQTAAKAKDHRRAERCFAVNIGQYATGADQEGSQGLHMRSGQGWTL